MPFTKEKSHYFRTNLCNRLIVILTEDISIYESYLVRISERTLENHAKVGADPDKVDVTDLVQLVYLYCQAKKSRLGAHLKNFYDPANQYKEKYPERFPKETFGEMIN
jgi:hypothetical protein